MAPRRRIEPYREKILEHRRQKITVNRILVSLNEWLVADGEKPVSERSLDRALRAWRPEGRALFSSDLLENHKSRICKLYNLDVEIKDILAVANARLAEDGSPPVCQRTLETTLREWGCNTRAARGGYEEELVNRVRHYYTNMRLPDKLILQELQREGFKIKVAWTVKDIRMKHGMKRPYQMSEERKAADRRRKSQQQDLQTQENTEFNDTSGFNTD